MKKTLLTASLFAAVAMLFLTMPAAADQLPDPDGKPADMSKPVQVFILMGQSNMLGFGKIAGGDGSLTHAVKEKGLYPRRGAHCGRPWQTRKACARVSF
jgi:hypothetical protein